MEFQASRSFAESMDRRDPLREYRDYFSIPTQGGREVVYLCGNSLGLCPVKAMDYVQQELERWQRLGVWGYFHSPRPWVGYEEPLLGMLAEIVGAEVEEVAMMHTLSTNLHLLLLSFYRPTARRFKILIEHNPFPTDRYALVSQLRLHKIDAAEALVELTPRKGEFVLRSEDILEAIEELGPSLALVFMQGVHYHTGQCFEMEKIATAAHQAGSMVGFDLAHAVGNVPLRLHKWEVDFAVWCSYKYLNGGPAAVGGAFVHQKHGLEEPPLRLEGWWGCQKEARFQMSREFDPVPGARGWQLSNSCVFSLAAQRASLEIFTQAGMEAICQKQRSLTGYLEFLLKAKIGEEKLTLLTPACPEHRGNQISLSLPGADHLVEQLKAHNIVVDHRPPDVIRLAPCPLYNRYQDIWQACQALEKILR